MQEMRVGSLGREDPVEKEMAIHSSILAWEIPRTEKPGGLQSTGSQESNMTLATKQQPTVYYSIIGVYTFDRLHLPPTPPPTSAFGNHESDLFFYEFVCWLLTEPQHYVSF